MSRDVVLAVAKARFAADGYERTTLRAVATDARVDPAMVLYLGDHLEGVVTFEVVDGRITNFYAMRNPEKLASVMVPRQIGR